MGTEIQYFKGDATEIKMYAVASPVLEQTIASLDDFYELGLDAVPFLLMLYDAKRMPFSERIKKDVYINFITQALLNFPATGTFDAYLFILISIFGELSEINFTVPAPGKLTIDINAISNTEFQFIGREFVDGSYNYFDMIDSVGNNLIFRGISGIETEYELQLLFSEIMPAGIIPNIILNFYSRYDFIGYDGSGIFDMVTMNQNDQIIFTEIGG